MLRQLAACGATAVGGVAFGVAYSEHPLARAALAKLSPTAPASVDAGDPQSLVAAAVRLSNDAGGLCVLSTRARDGGVSSRMVQPLPAVLDSEGSPSLLFHTTSMSTKFAELTQDGRCTLTFLDPAALTCITMIGPAERRPPLWKEAAQRLRPIRALSHATSAGSSSGRPPASGSLGQPRAASGSLGQLRDMC